ncbi:acetyl-CoA carboxylase biotin carboxyl carrier protein [Peribacillus asahii]|uniref:acetyl-CoA carboxylase biotin carboxyl carrier protein n=1 Tax=Peribacillus asahii TaxID=228899 RepID=UPI00207AF15D|nr:acetyl-CoA carboxylase biotin carboxyl carrier protein [Peribacillus asahii]USK58748.1 acetyl-CoA carboxylase biotin carboxyl carrier protein [Peribacillus asahii]
MKVQEIREIIKLVDQSNISEFSFEQEGSKIKLKKTEVGTVVYPTAAPEVKAVEAPKAEPAPVAAPVEAPKAAPAPAAAPVAAVAQDTEGLHKITSPMVGTFYQSPSPDADPYVKAGDKVTGDSIVCIVEAMKLFNEIEAEVNGEIVEVLVKDGELVEYGQALFLVKPE